MPSGGNDPSQGVVNNGQQDQFLVGNGQQDQVPGFANNQVRYQFSFSIYCFVSSIR